MTESREDMLPHGPFQGKKPELLAPAGNLAKLRTAFLFGADACYVGLKRFSMRQFAGNFSMETLEEGLAIARAMEKRVYVTVNILPNEVELPDMADHFRKLEGLRPHGVIVGDAGAFALARKVAPGLRLHLSTQMSVTNSASARFWFEQGISRIVLARELSIDEIGALVRRVPGPLEVFIHGAVCIAYSGRCLLSLYWAGRDPRRGACAQGCRWKYAELEDRLRPGVGNPVVEDERGTHFFDASDLCSLPVFDDLVATGVEALKIEGRTRSQQYVGVVTDVYRTAIDTLWSQGREGFRRRLPELTKELENLTQRGFSTHFLTGEVPADSYNPGGSKLGNRNRFLGEVVERHAGGLRVRLSNEVRPGEVVEGRSPRRQSERTVLDQIRSRDGEILELAQHGMIIEVPGEFEANAGALVRRGLTKEGENQ